MFIMFKPGNDYKIVPDSEFIISRTAFKDNSSYYKLNENKVQFKEISKLLRSHGVDLDHNRFLILQVKLYHLMNLIQLSSSLFFKLLKSYFLI